MKGALLGLAQLQQLLQSIHGVQAAPVRDFLVDRAFRERHAPRTSPHEALLLREDGEELHVGLFLDDAVLDQLAHPSASPWTHERLQGFCAAAEGVSHFLYLSQRARQGGQVSQLELEAQAEIDKYLAVLLQLWATGRRGASRELRRRLFERTALRAGLSAPERDRYRLASALAAACARTWEARYVLAGRLDALLREARRMYRLAGGEKFSALAHGAVAWAA
ncbi:MAG TPA: hypothetical protein VFA79_00555 [Myxococcales bacterium]|nr:hypothetical protein [Myxococcales bacterium]